MDAQETRIYTAAIITVIVFGGIVLYFIISILSQQRKNFAINKQIILAEMNAIEKDRTRIAYDLHDELGAMLSSIKLKMNIFELATDDDKKQMEKINDHIDKGLTRIREISYNLMPTVLINSGLRNALTDYANTIDKHILAIDIIFPENISFNEQASIHIYRIVQEVITNTIKHANASRLDIIFTEKKNKVIITVKDNGSGFEVNKIHHESLGLKSLHSRARVLDGKMFLESKAGKGTEYIFEIPHSL